MEGQRRQWNSSLPARKTPMKRVGFKPQNRDSITQGTPLKAKKPYVWKKGKRTKEWDKVRAELKPMFARAGITCCELGYPGCWRDNGLGFAHAKKRRNLKPEELNIVILACSANCHEVIENLAELEMEKIVLETIASRKTQPY